MFDGAILDVAIGMLLLFFVASLVASAMVEAVAGFLHRRSKHLWDTLDLLLGNTSIPDADSRSIVDELYKQPFITGLVRPTDRIMFDPASTAPAKRLPKRASPPKAVRQRALGATRALHDDELLRRFYGPINIDAREFTNALLAMMRPQGQLDTALKALNAIRGAIAEQPTGTDIALSEIESLVTELGSAADALVSKDFSDAVTTIKQAGESVDVEQLRSLVSDAESALVGLFTGDPTRAEIVAALGVVPKDLRVKMVAVLSAAGEQATDIRAGIEDWYERNMAAASTWYRKQTRYFLFVAGLVMAIFLNVDGVHAATTLYRDESTRTALVALAEDISKITCDAGNGAAPEGSVDTGEAAQPATTSADIDLDCVRDSVGGSLAFPVGWDGVDTSPRGWGLRVLGWIAIAGAVTVGAPFWFDLLSRALRMRRKSDDQD